MAKAQIGDPNNKVELSLGWLKKLGFKNLEAFGARFKMVGTNNGLPCVEKRFWFFRKPRVNQGQLSQFNWPPNE